MSTDIFTNSSVDLVIFTVVNRETLEHSLWSKDLVNYGRYPLSYEDELSLFVVTVAADPKNGKMLRSRVLPSGPVQLNKTLKDSATAIAAEKLGLGLRSKLRSLKVMDAVERPDSTERFISFAYWAMVDFEDIRKYLGGKDQVGLELVNSYSFMQNFRFQKYELEEFDGISRFGARLLPSSKHRRGHVKINTKALPEGQILGFDHDEIVFYAWRAMRHAFESKFDPFLVLGINPLGSEFRLSQFQEFQEICRGELVQRDYFRRQFLNQLDINYAPIDKTDRSKPGKPAKLYRSLSFEPDPNSTEVKNLGLNLTDDDL
jgi:ADP-ribose pyrophosphatase YjhB (NUDIX family)